MEDFVDLAVLTSSSISLQLRRNGTGTGALVSTGAGLSEDGGDCPSLLTCSLSLALIVLIDVFSGGYASSGD